VVYITHSNTLYIWGQPLMYNLLRRHPTCLSLLHRAQSTANEDATDPYVVSEEDPGDRTCDMSHSCVWHDAFMCVTWLIHVFDMTHSYVWHDSFICVRWLLHVWHDSYTCVTWLVHMCEMTYSYVWHDSFTCVTWLIHVFDMTSPCVWYDSFIRVTWLIHMCDMTRSNA